VPSDPDVGAAFGFADDLPLTRDAIAFAQAKHSCQRRAADGAPFLLHPLEVASMLKRSRYPDHVIAAAVLHDVIEDTDAERSDLRARFGPEVSELVALVSDDPTIDDEEERKDDVRARVQHVGGHGLVVYAADKVSKVRELRMLIAAGLEPDAADIKLTRYRKSLAMLEEATPDSRLVELLRFEVEALEMLPPGDGELAARQNA
jgi:(p)ppGpp synthase/HD superfamily hydrolase